MEISGKIIAVLPARSGVSQKSGNEWMSQEFVIETHDQYPRKCCFSVFGKDKLEQFAIKAGEELKVSFDIDAHEYNGRWFNSVNAWKVERTYADQAAPVTQVEVGEGDALEQQLSDKFGAVPVGQASDDDLPF